MMSNSNKNKRYIENLPKFKVEPLDENNVKYVCGFRSALDSKNQYAEYSIGEYLVNDAYEDQKSGKGMTYLIINKDRNKVIAFFTISTASLMILLEHDGDERSNADLIIENFISIPSVKIDYFAVDVDYQDLFFEDLPLSAHIFNTIILILCNMSNTKIGFQAIFLYSLESSKKFYVRNGLSKMTDSFVASEGVPINDVSDLLYMFIYKQNIDDFVKK